MVLGVLVLLLTFVMAVRGLITGEPCSRSAPQVTSVEQQQTRLPDVDEPCTSDAAVRAMRGVEWVFGFAVVGLLIAGGRGCGAVSQAEWGGDLNLAAGAVRRQRSLRLGG